MYRIGILGSENSHAMAFAQIINGIREEQIGEFCDMRVTAALGRYPEANEALRAGAGVEQIVSSPEELIGRVDAVMVTARDGRFHAAYARPFLLAGLPAFIDKPFTSDGEEALDLARTAKMHGAPLCGGSTLKLCRETQQLAARVREGGEGVLGGFLCAPINLHNEYGGFYFYSAHLAEICLTVFGQHPAWVAASPNETGISVLVHYDGYDAACLYAEKIHQYAGTVVSRDGGIFMREISLENAYVDECRAFACMLRTGRMPHSYEELVQPVLMLNAIERAAETGTRQPVPAAVL